MYLYILHSLEGIISVVMQGLGASAGEKVKCICLCTPLDNAISSVCACILQGCLCCIKPLDVDRCHNGTFLLVPPH